MKHQAIQYLALDVHQATVVAPARDERGAIRMRATVPTEAKAIVNFVRGVGPRVHVVFEEGSRLLFRARAVRTPGVSVYRPSQRGSWLAKLENRGSRLRAQSLLEELNRLLELRPRAKAAMMAEARRQPGWKILRSIPFFGPVRMALILAIMVTPFRFRTKRNLWPYAGLAVMSRSSSDEECDGTLRRRRQSAPDLGAESESQSRSEGGVQRSGECGGGKTGTAPGLLPRQCRSRRPRGAGQAHSGAQDRLDHPTPLEERRALGSGTTDDASERSARDAVMNHECG